ncbi:MAG: hypothetical protein ACOYU3_02720, partial [Bacillota bacterium]
MMKRLAPLLLAFAFVMVFLSFVTPAVAAPDSCITYSGNDNDLNTTYPAYHWTKLDPAPAGTHTVNLDGGKTITLVIVNTDGYTKVASWTSNTTIYKISVKGGTKYNLYSYTGGAMSDGTANLVAPNNASGHPANISHITIGYTITTATPTLEP